MSNGLVETNAHYRIITGRNITIHRRQRHATRDGWLHASQPHGIYLSEAADLPEHVSHSRGKAIVEANEVTISKIHWSPLAVFVLFLPFWEDSTRCIVL